jgi:hypothetical protein
MNPEANTKTNRAELVDALREHLDRAREIVDEFDASAGGDQTPNHRLADEYDASAGVLRRRAARPDRSAEQADEELRRAQWYERRAAVMRAGGRMPADLRTPQESLALVHELRVGVLALANVLAELSVPDVVAFTAALRHEGGATTPSATTENATIVLNAFAEHVGNVLSMLGGRQKSPEAPIVLLPYDPPTYKVLSTSVLRNADA